LVFRTAEGNDGFLEREWNDDGGASRKGSTAVVVG